MRRSYKILLLWYGYPCLWIISYTLLYSDYCFLLPVNYPIIVPLEDNSLVIIYLTNLSLKYYLDKYFISILM